MKYKNEEYRRREARAQKAAVNLLGVIPWRIKSEPALLPAKLRNGLNAPDAGLIILPSGGSHPREFDAAVWEARATLLILEPGTTTEGAPTYYFSVVRPLADRISGTCALRLWLDLDRKAFLVPYECGPTPDEQCFALDALGVTIVLPPWRDAVDREFGLKQADAVLLAP